MFNDFQSKYPNTQFSYELYRKIVSDDLNISFAALGNEECWDCEEFVIHKKSTSHDATLENVSECDVCKKWTIHKLKYSEARKEYQLDAEKKKSEEELVVSADLQKVSKHIFNLPA